jgi:hypothetical protein
MQYFDDISSSIRGEEMPTTIFYSWQVDTAPRVGRNLIERALHQAISRISDDAAIEDVVRDDISIDRDTVGAPGFAPIVETIFQKIDKAAVFVPDLSFVGTRLDGLRPTPNPNVLIEYGWAIKSLGYSRVMPIMNTAFGEPTASTMPFDMRHLRYPILYNCPADADEDTRKKVRETLARSIEKALQTILASDDYKSSLHPPDIPSPFLPHEPKDGPGRFRKPDEAIGVSEVIFMQGGQPIYLSKEPVVWFRVMPTVAQNRNWLVTDLRTAATQRGWLHTLGKGWTHFGSLRSHDGFGNYVSPRDPAGETYSVVYAFTNGEVWAIDSYILSALKRNGQNVIPPYEEELRSALGEYADFLERLGIKPPYRWIAGMENLKGRGVINPSGRMALYRGPMGSCLEDIITSEGLYTPGEPVGQALRPLFVKLFDSCGVERPAQLDN